MKAALVWKDGRREDARMGGVNRIFTVHRVGDDIMETCFDLDRIEDGVWLYLEGESVNANARFEEAVRRNRERTMEVFRRGLAAEDDS